MKRGKFFLFLIVILFLVPLLAISSSNYEIDTYFISNGGNNISSSNYENDLIVGEISGNSSSTNYNNDIGFFYTANATSSLGYFLNINLVSPAEGFSTGTLSHNFTFNTSSKYNVSNCSLVLDGTSIDSVENVSNNTNTGIYVSSMSVGLHYWNVSCYDNQSNLNTSSTRSLTIVSSSSSSSSSSGGGGSGGGGIIATSPSSSTGGFTIVPEIYEKNLDLNKVEFDILTIRNLESSSKSFSISEESLDGILILEDKEVIIAGNEEQRVEFKLISPNEIGVYTGKIIISSGGTRKELLVSLNVNEEKGLFDIVVTIPPSEKVIRFAKTLTADFDLIQMGLKEKLDVTLNYVVKDFDGKVYLVESETIAVYDKKTHEKEFHIEGLEEGDYVLGVELVYPDGVAVASSYFKIKKGLSTKSIMSLAIIFILVGIILALGFAIKRYKRMRRHLK